MKIYTKTGDSGDTSLFDGTRVRKTDPRVVAYGDVDELQACLGVARAAKLPQDLDDMCLSLQRDLFALGARLADPSHKIAKRVEKIVIDEASVARLEGWIDQLDTELPRFATSFSRTALPVALSSIWRAPCAGAPSARCCCLARTWSSRWSSSTSIGCPTCCSRWRGRPTIAARAQRRPGRRTCR